MNIEQYDNSFDNVRQLVIDGETWFAVEDIIDRLEDDRPRILRVLDRLGSGSPTRDFEDLLKSVEIGGEKLKFANPVGVFRLLQSIKGPRAEALRRKIARAAFERAQDDINPEGAVNRAIGAFRRAGRTNSWIEARLRSIHARNTFTEELQKRGISDSQEFAILTDTVHREAFGVSTKEHKAIKGLKSQNLRDHMSEIELTLTTLGEQTSTAIASTRDAHGFAQARAACEAGGRIAGRTRRNIELIMGEKVVTEDNFLPESGVAQALEKDQG